MDRERFDALARLVWTGQTRRAALGSLLGAAVLGSLPEPATAKPKPKDKTQRKRKRKKRKRGNRAVRRSCYSSSGCVLSAEDSTYAGCDFARATEFFDLDLRGFDLSRTNLTEAQLAKADLRNVDLSEACLVGANLLNATIDDTTNLDGAILCRTLMADGTTDDSGCDQGTRCCPTPDPLPICAPEECEGEDCIRNVAVVCSIFGTPCCPALSCVPALLPSPFLTTCQTHCEDDTRCQQLFGTGSFCRVDPIGCPYIGRCCSRPE